MIDDCEGSATFEREAEGTPHDESTVSSGIIARELGTSLSVAIAAIVLFALRA